MTQRSVKIEDPAALSAIFGELDRYAAMLENEYNITIRNRDELVLFEGLDEENVVKAADVVRYLQKLVAVNHELTEQNVRYAICMANENRTAELRSLDNDCICVTAKGKPIKAKTIGQKNYIEAIQKNTITFGIGPAGTGKTFLAVAAAVTALKNKSVSRIVLTRPAVEAGEKLGFLPGDLHSKIDPYLRPLYDALYEMLGFENYQKHAQRGVVEIAPLAYMRGRTLDDSFIILDEAQNTTPQQMKMFLTRLGFNSKVVINGDITQIDLPGENVRRGARFYKGAGEPRSGLVEALKILDNIDDIAIHTFTAKDVVRHKLVMRIIAAYDKLEQSRKSDETRKLRMKKNYEKPSP